MDSDLEEEVTPNKSDVMKLFNCEVVASDKLKFTKESTTSMTPHKLAKMMSKNIVDVYCKFNNCKPTSIIDATANVGGNCVAFCQYYRHVLAFEIKANTANCLRANLSQYNVRNVQVINADFVKYINAATLAPYDVIFIDPPWYISGERNAHLSLTYRRNSIYDVPIEEIILRIRAVKKVMVVVKTPLDFCPQIPPSHRIDYRKMSLIFWT